jgi:trimethylamine---corrinoid protein Co-methyltransferase
MSTTKPLMTTAPRLDLGILSAADVHAVHEAALVLLGDRAAAAEAARAGVPVPVVLPGRTNEQDLALDGANCWLAAGSLAGPAASVRRHNGAAPRAATVADLEDLCRLADALPEVGLVAGPPVRVAGVSPLGALASVLAATSKHVLAIGLHSAAEGEAAVRLAEAAGEGRRPLSLCAGPDGREAALAAARAGVPVGLVLPPAGDVAPIDDLGRALARHHAGVLAGWAAVREAAPAAPFFCVAAPALAGLPAAGPAAVKFQLAAAQLAAHLGLPMVAAGMATTSAAPDWQACMQNAFAALSTTAARTAVTAGAGTLADGAVVSLIQLVMDSEIYSWNAMIARGVHVDEETIALDAIKDVGIGGNFLGQRHTRRHMRDVWRPRLLDRSMWDAWVASGREGAYEKAATLVDQMLANHAPVPLGDEARGMVARIAAEAGL